MKWGQRVLAAAHWMKALGMLERGLAADAGADEELADLAPEPCGVGDDGAEIDVVGHPVERAAQCDQRAGVVGDHGALGIVDDGAGMGQFVPDLQEGRELDRRGLADGAPEQGPLGDRIEARCGGARCSRPSPMSSDTGKLSPSIGG